MYSFTLLKNGFPVAIYTGSVTLPDSVINHEYPTRQMKNILSDYGYTLLRYY